MQIRGRSKSWRRGQCSGEQLLRAGHNSEDPCHFMTSEEIPMEIFQHKQCFLPASNSGIWLVIIVFFLEWMKISQVREGCRLEGELWRWLAGQAVRWSVRGCWAPSREVIFGWALTQCFFISPGHSAPRALESLEMAGPAGESYLGLAGGECLGSLYTSKMKTNPASYHFGVKLLLSNLCSWLIKGIMH